MPIKTSRVTKPRGTYLSNPSTIASGSLGAGAGKNPGGGDGATLIPQVNPYAQRWALKENSFGSKMIQAVKNWWNGLPGTQGQNQNNLFYPLPGHAGTPFTDKTSTQTFNGKTTTYNNPDIAYDYNGNKYQYDQSTKQYVRSGTGILSAPQSSTLNANVLGGPVQAYANNLVGLNMSDSTPKQLEMKTAMQIYAGLPQDQVIKNMAQMGYEFQKGPRGGTFVLSQNGGGGGGGSNGGYVDPTSLAKGEVAKTDYGTFIGREKINGGKFDGKSQYTLTFKMKKGQNFNTVVKQDANGNWVRYNIPVYDSGNYRGGRGRNKQPAQSNNKYKTTEATSQLVNLRVNYG